MRSAYAPALLLHTLFAHPKLHFSSIFAITQKSYASITRSRLFGGGESNYAQAMQRLFSMFPQGGPGIALLLLRVSVAALFSLNLMKGAGLLSSSILLLLVLASSALMVIGFLTSIVSFLVGSLAVAILLIHFQWDNLIFFFISINAIALGLLGPGAYSLDARLFGRRVTVLSGGKDSRRT